MPLKRRTFYSHWGMRILLVFLAGAVLAAAGNYAVQDSTSTSTPKPRAQRHRPMPPQFRRLKKMGENALTPNPKFQPPHAQSMPAHAPKAPVLIIPEAPPQPTGTERFFRGAAKIMTTTWNENIFVWLPAFSTDPNGGPTYGILPVLVLAERENHHIRHLLAPSYTYNDNFGQTVTGRYYFYPTDESQLFTTASYSQHTNREVKIRYENTAFLGGRIYIRGEGYYDADGSLRFFGIGPQTRSQDESGYTGHDKVIHGDMGVNFFQSWRFSLGLRYRRVGFDPPIVPGVRDLATRFPSLDLHEQNTVVQEAHLLWDTRDIPITPTKGTTGELFFEKTAQSWGSDSDYIRYGVDGKRFFPWMDGKQITAVHARYDWANGSNIPFYEMAMLGGRDTLRGFGEGRFMAQGRMGFKSVERMELTSISLMGVTTKFEVGPFYDVGTVFPRPQDASLRDMRHVVGGFFRAVVKPNVVGSVDVGVGKEGVGPSVS